MTKTSKSASNQKETLELLPPDELQNQKQLEFTETQCPDLEETNRQLCAQSIAVNQKMIRLYANGVKGSSPELIELEKQLEKIHEEQEKIKAEIKEKVKTQENPKCKPHIQPKQLPASHEPGLVRVQHPNHDFFLADMFNYALKDDGASMEAPIFTLSTKPDLDVWEWTSKDGKKSVQVTPSVRGRATQHDKDVLIYVVSQLTEALNRGRDDAKNRTVRFTVYDFLVTTNRRTDGRGYQRLHEVFERLSGTRITTDIQTGGQRIREGFGIIDRWKIIEKSPTDERMIAVEVTLSEWLYNAVSAFEVLTIHIDYFRLRKPLARRLYEIARKHCGRQTQWTINLDLLKEKTGSKASLKEFRRSLRSIETDDSLPEYRFVVGNDDKVRFYRLNCKKLAQSALKTLQLGAP